MRFLLDQDVYFATSQYLLELSHDVTSASDLGLSRASDRELLMVAKEQERILFTRDRDFGNLVFVEGIAAGVIYLRLNPASLEAARAERARAPARRSRLGTGCDHRGSEPT